jgi:DNA-directed RNA polymerase specialized sigma24 family protein
MESYGYSKDHAFVGRIERDITALSRELGDPAVGLPSDLATSLRYLENSELQRLQVAIEAEIARRKPGASTGKADEVFAPTAARPVSSSLEAAKIAEIPEGKANLVRASFEAGLKARTIARTFGVSVSQVNRIIRSAEKSNAR